MSKTKSTMKVYKDVNQIKSYIEDISSAIINYIDSNSNSDYLLITKHITHSDLPNFGKQNGYDEPLSKNILYYISVPEMEEIEERENRKFAAAPKQSNIYMPVEFYDTLGIVKFDKESEREGNNYKHILVNDYANIFLVNDTLEYFNIDYSFKVFQKLQKEVRWNKEDYRIELTKDGFTPVELRYAIHGIGTSRDEVFHKLRANIFKNDSFIVLIETKNDGNKNVFIMLDKNPIFFSIINETNEAWEKYQTKEKKLVEYNIDQYVKDLIEEEKNRKYQTRWKNNLAAEMMNYTTTEGGVFCPFTYIEGNFEDIGTLFRASHIKAFEDCDSKEAYDIDNGLLLVANADALFDKHLITVNESKDLIFSFLLEHDNVLKSKLLLNQPIFKMVLNENRMKYIEEHRKKFYEKEEKRKK